MIKFLAVFLFIFLRIYSEEIENPQLQIQAVLEQWPKDFNAKNVDPVCSLFAPDLIASYPGTKDVDYEQMCGRLRAAMNEKNRQFHYDLPEIEQILVMGDWAVVRLIWTLTIDVKKPIERQVIREKGLDVFKKQSDGSWKIAISFAYTLEN